MSVSFLVLALLAGADASLAEVPPRRDPVIAGAGDIACEPEGGDDGCHDRATSDLLVALDPEWVFTLGDNQYPDGSLEDFRESYGRSWGRLKTRTHPALGNHEYGEDGMNSLAYARRNYFGYFDDPTLAGDPARGYYSYDVPTSGEPWHVIVLNTGPCFDEARARSFCGVRSRQRAWLRKDLEEHHRTCILAYWHQPLFSDGAEHGDDPVSRAFWNDLYAHGATLVVNGHEHVYERFAPMDPRGRRDDLHGISEFVVGTGGGPAGSCRARRRATSQVCSGGVHGVLALTLHASSFTYEFKPAQGTKFADGPRTLPCRAGH